MFFMFDSFGGFLTPKTPHRKIELIELRHEKMRSVGRCLS